MITTNSHYQITLNKEATERMKRPEACGEATSDTRWKSTIWGDGTCEDYKNFN